MFQKKKEDRISKQQRLIRIGKVKYILIDGLLRSGLGLGLAMTAGDLIWDDTRHDWRFIVVKWMFTGVFFGLVTGANLWDSAFSQKGPPPFPPIK